MKRKRIYFYSIASITAILVAYMIRPFFGVIVTSMSLAYIINPSKSKFRKIVKNNSLASLLAAITWISIFVFFGYILSQMAVVGIRELQILLSNQDFTPRIESINQILIQYNLFEFDPNNLLNEESKIIGYLGSLASKFIFTIPLLMLNIGLTIILTYFFLEEGPKLISNLVQIFPEKDHKILESFMSDIDAVLRGILFGHILTAIVTGTISYFVLRSFAIPQYSMITLGITILSMLPLIGGSIVPMILGVGTMVVGNFSRGLLLLVFGIALSFVDNIIKPLVAKRTANISPLFMTLGLISGPLMFGIFGFIIGPAIFGVLEIAINDLILIQEIDDLAKKK